jgi:L-rhamnose-H+ transport protein
MGLGFVVLAIACVFQGSFGLGMKNYRPFSWEAFWLIFSVIGVLCIPIIWTRAEVPGFTSYILQTPASILLIATACGFFWGISAIWYGKAIDSIGLSLTVGISTGVGCSVGALIPMFILDTTPPARSLAVLLAGMAVMLAGVGVITRAGLLKDRERASDCLNPQGVSMLSGLILAFGAGLGAATQNIGFTFAGKASALAVAAGVNPVSASLIAYVIVFAGGGFLANAGYALLVLIKNGTFGDFSRPGSAFAYGKAVLTGLIWFGALGLYAKSTALLGDLGPVIGWIVFLSGSVVISNGWGIKTGEWTGFDRPRRVLLLGTALLLIAVIIVGYANSLV